MTQSEFPLTFSAANSTSQTCPTVFPAANAHALQKTMTTVTRQINLPFLMNRSLLRICTTWCLLSAIYGWSLPTMTALSVWQGIQFCFPSMFLEEVWQV